MGFLRLGVCSAHAGGKIKDVGKKIIELMPEGTIAGGYTGSLQLIPAIGVDFGYAVGLAYIAGIDMSSKKYD